MSNRPPTIAEQMQHDVEEIDRLCSCVYKGDAQPALFMAGESIARAATEGLGVLMKARYGTPEERFNAFIELDLFHGLPASFVSEGDLTPERLIERVRLTLKMVKDGDPGDGADPLLRLIVAVGATERVCVVDQNGDYVLWMRSEPPGKVRPDVALYLEATGKWQYMTRYDIKKDIARHAACHQRMLDLLRQGDDPDRPLRPSERAFLTSEETLP